MRQTRVLWRALLVAATVLVAAPAARAATAVETGMRLGTLEVHHPQEAPVALVFLFSDQAGWTPELAEAAGDLTELGIVVAGVDLPAYLRALRADEGECLYLISEIEEMAHRLERRFGFANYRVPILAGVGAGATLAYAALAQSPFSTIAGIATLDPVSTVATGKPLCEGAPVTVVGDAFAYGRREGLPGWWRLGRRGTEEGPLAWAETLPEAEIEIMPEATETGYGLRRLIEPAIDEMIVADVGELADLPLVELPAAGSPEALAIIFSGDGGWRDIDKQIGEQLAAADIGVVGWDSLRYFWQERTPDEVAKDVVRVIDHYSDAWNIDRVLLIGYSFGADVLPAVVARLPEAYRARVAQTSLLGLTNNASFVIRVTGWLGAATGDHPIAPEAAKLDMHRVQCFYGEEETDTLCPDPMFDRAERIMTKGGHHFDGDYVRLAVLIRDGFERRRSS